jgi:hypothetical protein
LSRDRLDLERKLLGMASPRALALLELTALSSRGCNEFALGHLYGVLELEPGLQALAAVEVRALLQPLAPLFAPHGFGSIGAVHRRGLRNQLIDQLARSPRLLAWRARRVEIAASLQPADYLVRSDGRDLALRAWLLAGLSPDEIAALLGEPEEAIDYVSATRDILPEPPTLAALGRLHGDVAIRILAPYLAARAQHPMDDIGDLLQAGLAAIERGACDEPSLRAFVQLAAMCGRDDLLARVPPGAVQARSDIELLQLAFGSSDPVPVAAIAERAVVRGKAETWPAPLLVGGLQRLALLAVGGSVQRQLLLRMHKRLMKQHANLQADEWIVDAVECLEAGIDVRAPLLPAQTTRADAALAPMSALVWLLLQRWFSLRGPAHAEAAVERALERMRAADLQRMAHWVEQARSANAERGPAVWRSPEAPWQQLLGVLSELASQDSRASRSTGERKHSRIRIVLQEVLESGCVLRIEFFEQKPSTRGGWTGGRRILSAHEAKDALQRLAPDNDADRNLLRALGGPGARFYGTRLSADSPALLALAECPEVYQEDGIQPLKVRIEKPALTVAKHADGRVELTLSPQPEPDCDALALLDGDCLRVVRFRPEHRRIAKLAAQGGNLLPEDSLPQVLALAPALSQSLAIEAAVDSAELIEDVDARVHVLLEPLREGLRLRLRARPLGEEGMLVVPGLGQRELIGLRGGQPVRAVRDLDGERRALKALVDAVPLLAGSENGEPLDMAQPEEALEALSQLTELGESVPLIWPAGQRWAMSKTRAAQQLSLKVRAQRDWFHAEGGLALDDGQVVSLAQLLQALPSAQGRFLRLGGDRIIALTQDLTRKLHGLRALSDERGKIELAPVAAAALEPWLESGAEIEIDRKFREQLAKMERAAALMPALPAGFEAELRDYQLDGYRWMMRLAEWGGGACLADDMGLGKTVQALAVLAARAHLGPALVVAPTSVVANWRAEARRFAPALELRVYGDGDRAEGAVHAGTGPPGAGQLWPGHSEHRGLRRGRVRHPGAGRGAGGQERGRAAQPGDAQAQGAGAHRHHRHADREPPRRAVEPDAHPQPRVARQPGALRQALHHATGARSARARARHPAASDLAFPAAPAEVAGAGRAAAAHRDRAQRRTLIRGSRAAGGAAAPGDRAAVPGRQRRAAPLPRAGRTHPTAPRRLPPAPGRARIQAQWRQTRPVAGADAGAQGKPPPRCWCSASSPTTWRWCDPPSTMPESAINTSTAVRRPRRANRR